MKNINFSYMMKMSKYHYMSFYWYLIYALGMMFVSPQLDLGKLSGEVTDLKFSKNVKAIFIFKIKLVW